MQTHAVNGAVAITLAQLFKLPFQAASLLILARLLQPVDYGIFAMVDPLVSMMGLLLDFGIGQSLIQSPSLQRSHASAFFWIMSAGGVIGGALMLVAAPFVAALYNEPRVAAVVAASSLLVLMASMTTVPEAILNRQMRFGWLAVISAVGIAVGFAVGLAAALLGAHYWALTLDYMATSLVTLGGVWIAVRWLPRDKPNFSGLFPFFKLGAAVMVSYASNLVSREADSILIGRYLGPRALGYYDRGNKLAIIPMQRINQVLQSLMVPILSRLADDGGRFRRAYLRIIRQLMLVMMPGTVAVGVTAPVLVPFLLGSQWAPAAPIFAWLALSALHRPVSMTMNFVYISQGRGGAMIVWSVFSAITSVIAFVIGLRWGAVGVAAAFALSDILVRAPFLWWSVTRTGSVRLTDLIASATPFVTASAVVFVALSLLQRAPFPSAFINLAVSAVAAYAISLGVVCLFKNGRETLADTIHLVRTETPRFLPRGLTKKNA